MTQDVIAELLHEVILEQARQREQLERILQVLGGGARSAHVALLVAIAETVGDRTFTGTQLFAHARVSPDLEDALEAADITNARELGWLCRRLEGTALPGVRLERGGESRAGVVWRVRVFSSETRDE